MTHVILLGIVGLVGGTFGSMVGLGGGVFIIPALTLFLGVPIHSAISASLIAVVATSTTAAAAYVREDLSNMRLGMTMETMTVTGALVGGFVGAALSKGVLSAIFGAVMIAVSGYMLIAKRTVKAPLAHDADLGVLGHSYFDRSAQDRRQLSGAQASGGHGRRRHRGGGLRPARRGRRLPQGAGDGARHGSTGPGRGVHQ